MSGFRDGISHRFFWSEFASFLPSRARVKSRKFQLVPLTIGTMFTVGSVDRSVSQYSGR